MNLIELILDENEEVTGVNTISLVERPAIKLPFITLKDDIEEVKLAEVNKNKRLLMGACLIPDKPIARKDKKTGDTYYIYFSKDTVRRVSELFQKNSHQNNSTEEHKTKLKGNTVVETWIKEDDTHDKSVLYNLKAPLHSWCVTMKVEDDETYDKALRGELNGFSIEGLFANKFDIKQSDVMTDEDRLIAQIIDVLNG